MKPAADASLFAAVQASANLKSLGFCEVQALSCIGPAAFRLKCCANFVVIAAVNSMEIYSNFDNTVHIIN